MKAKWAFTSDTHFWHRKMQEHRNYLSLEDMHSDMIRAWNADVDEETSVYHLGDVSFAGFSRTQEIIEQLNGNLKIVPGNHDDINMLKRLKTKNGLVEVMKPLLDLRIGLHNEDGTSNVLRFALCHFPMRVWNRSHYGAMHLHGHSHGWLQAVGRMLDVGVDGPLSEGHSPVMLEIVMDYMRPRKFVQEDQHSEGEAHND